MAMTIDEVMETAVVKASPEDSVAKLRDRMSTHDVGAIPVVDDTGVLVGIVTSDDLVTDYPATLPTKRIMTAPVQSLPPAATVQEAARLMRTQRCHHLVVTEGNKVTGILSAFDLLRVVEEV